MVCPFIGMTEAISDEPLLDAGVPKHAVNSLEQQLELGPLWLLGDVVSSAFQIWCKGPVMIIMTGNK